MNKKTKIILIIIVTILSVIILDTALARILKNSPIISWKEKLEDKDSWVDRGLLIDTYYCTKETDIVTVSWHLKNSKYACPVDNNSLTELNAINQQIIDYFKKHDVKKYPNYSYNYVDEKNKKVIVGLKDNSESEQQKFKETIVNSELIKFEEGEITVTEK